MCNSCLDPRWFRTWWDQMCLVTHDDFLLQISLFNACLFLDVFFFFFCFYHCCLRLVKVFVLQCPLNYQNIFIFIQPGNPKNQASQNFLKLEETTTINYKIKKILFNNHSSIALTEDGCIILACLHHSGVCTILHLVSPLCQRVFIVFLSPWIPLISCHWYI